MAYSIGYAPQRHEVCAKRPRIRFGVLVLAFFVVFLISAQLLSQEGARLLRQMILPFQEETVEAFSAMVQSVEQGVPVSEAVTAFCREVIEGGQLP